MKTKTLTASVLVALLVGVAVGYYLGQGFTPSTPAYSSVPEVSESITTPHW